jgi:O-antigen ligase
MISERWFGYSDLVVTSSVDNEWLEVLFGTGLLGFLVLAMTIALLWKHVIRLLRITTRGSEFSFLIVEAAAVFAYITFRSFFVTKFFIWHPPLTFLLILGYVQYQCQKTNGNSLTAEYP